MHLSQLASLRVHVMDFVNFVVDVWVALVTVGCVDFDPEVIKVHCQPRTQNTQSIQGFQETRDAIFLVCIVLAWTVAVVVVVISRVVVLYIT
jgi:hypothetical protein